jgi:hypothetical protein
LVDDTMVGHSSLAVSISLPDQHVNIEVSRE